jgi:hypothetical protein
MIDNTPSNSYKVLVDKVTQYEVTIHFDLCSHCGIRTPPPLQVTIDRTIERNKEALAPRHIHPFKDYSPDGWSQTTTHWALSGGGMKYDHTISCDKCTKKALKNE